MYSAYILTISDKGSPRGTCRYGWASIKKLLEDAGFSVIKTGLVFHWIPLRPEKKRLPGGYAAGEPDCDSRRYWICSARQYA